MKAKFVPGPTAGLSAPLRSGRDDKFWGGTAGGVAEVGGGAAFDPEDVVGVFGFEEEFEVVADVDGALAEAGSFFDFAEAIEFGLEADEGVGGGEVGVAAVFEEVGAVGELEAAELVAVEGVGHG